MAFSYIKGYMCGVGCLWKAWPWRSHGLIMNFTDNSYTILYYLQTNQWWDIVLQHTSKLHKFCIPQTNSPETIMWWWVMWYVLGWMNCQHCIYTSSNWSLRFCRRKLLSLCMFTYKQLDFPLSFTCHRQKTHLCHCNMKVLASHDII